MPKDSPDSGVESNDKHASLAEQDSFDELEDEEPLPVIGTCTALYAFEGKARYRHMHCIIRFRR